MSSDGRMIPANALLSKKKPTAKEKALDKSLVKYMDEEMKLESDAETNRRKNVTYELEVLFKQFVKKVAMNKGMTEEEAEDAGGELRLSGSYRLGVRDVGADIDTICVAPNFVDRDDFFTLLQEELVKHKKVTDFSSIPTAKVPIMTFDYDEVNIDLQFARLASNKVKKNFDVLDDDILKGIDDATEKSINGPRVTNMISALVKVAKEDDG